MAAARARFTRDGYERTTIRAVAADAGVDPSMVMRYYGSKEGLFGAATDLDLQLPDPSGVPLEALGGLLARHFVDRWEGALADEAIMLLLRSAVTNDRAAEQIRTVFGRQVVSLVREATGGAPDSELRAGLLSTQLLGVALSRYLLRLPPLVALDRETLIEVLAPILGHILTGPQPAQPAAGGGRL